VSQRDPVHLGHDDVREHQIDMRADRLLKA
jgi:hypothetical protein